MTYQPDTAVGYLSASRDKETEDPVLTHELCLISVLVTVMCCVCSELDCGRSRSVNDAACEGTVNDGHFLCRSKRERCTNDVIDGPFNVIRLKNQQATYIYIYMCNLDITSLGFFVALNGKLPLKVQYCYMCTDWLYLLPILHNSRGNRK